MTEALTDSDLMPFGAHQGQPMARVPAEYLDWLLGQDWFRESRKWAPVRAYIEANIDAIHEELEDD